MILPKLISKVILKVLLISLLIFSKHKAHATHGIGYDFQIEYLAPNLYRAHIKVFRDVNGIGMPSSMLVTVYDKVTLGFVKNFHVYDDSVNNVLVSDSCFNTLPNPVINYFDKGEFHAGSVFQSQHSFTLPDNPNGYILYAYIPNRNALPTNFDQPLDKQMILLATMADPALGPNSLPDFGQPPKDLYFCTNSSRIIDYNVTDPDGDSLYFSLTEPLTYASATTAQISAGYPYFPTMVWSTGHSLLQPLGPGSSMSINPGTGVITATANNTGYFGFSILVEEFRNSVKIGETRREMQYIAINCPCVSTSNIESIESRNDLWIYPNPSNNIVNVEFGNKLNGEFNAVINDMLGRVVLEQKNIKTNKILISKENIGKGVFLLNLINNKTGERVFIEKIVVQ